MSGVEEADDTYPCTFSYFLDVKFLDNDIDEKNYAEKRLELIL